MAEVLSRLNRFLFVLFAMSRSPFQSVMDAIGGDSVPEDEQITPPRVRGRVFIPKPALMMSRDLSSEVANFARAARAASGLDRKAFARKSGVAVGYIVVIETGKRRSTPSHPACDRRASRHPAATRIRAAAHRPADAHRPATPTRNKSRTRPARRSISVFVAPTRHAPPITQYPQPPSPPSNPQRAIGSCSPSRSAYPVISSAQQAGYSATSRASRARRAAWIPPARSSRASPSR